jgi:release factor glutamine methyltransferase
MPELKLAPVHALRGPPAALRPSEYTAALIQVLHARISWARDANALEIGCGSGVVLAALGALGAASLCGIDIENEAVLSGSLLLRELDYSAHFEFHRGDMWRPVAGRRFNLIAANLPHFPMEPQEIGCRLPSWSSGGTDGRTLLDRFLDGLPQHLTPGGRVVMTHNGFLDLDVSRSIVDQSGLSLRIAQTILVYISGEKLALMNRDILCAEEGRSIYRYGPYAFGEMHIVEIGSPEALA